MRRSRRQLKSLAGSLRGATLSALAAILATWASVPSGGERVAGAWAATVAPTTPPPATAPVGSAPIALRIDPTAGQNAYDWKHWADFWAFRPVVKPTVPVPADSPIKADWVRNPIDAFVGAKLRAAGLSPAGEADKLTLVRRVTFDLTGLPPTPEEIRAFLADASPDAYEGLVDRLLASPHYGEHWGRHWLDVARYVPGRVSFVGVKNTAGDSHYRDYVVRAFNQDKPYDRFVTEQLAGDLLAVPVVGQREGGDSVAKGKPAAGGSAGSVRSGSGSKTDLDRTDQDRSDVDRTVDRAAYLDQLVAPAFLSIGSWFDMDTDPNRLRLEMVDEMVNVTSKAFLGVSVACARCHDHKFDPVSTQDYYALGGIFRSTRLLGELNAFWRDGRVRQLRPLALPDEVAANEQVRAKAAELKRQRWDLLSMRHAELTAAWGREEAKYRSAALGVTGPSATTSEPARDVTAQGTAVKPVVVTFEAEDFDGQSNLRIAQLRKGDQATDVLETLNPTAQYVVYRVVVPDTGVYRLTALHSTDDRTPIAVAFNGDAVATAALTEPTGGADPLYQRWDAAGSGFLRAGVNFVRLSAKSGLFPRLDRLRLVKVDDDLDRRVSAVAVERGLDARLLARFVESPTDPWPTVADVEAMLPEADRATVAHLSAEMDRLAATVKPFSLAVGVTDQPDVADLPVHLRGQTYRTSDYLVPRGVPRFLDHALPRPAVPAGHSGRLELAHWLTDPRHPLTARVMVNRVWGWHFGRGIVDSPDDFGSRGSPPSHPELLDWLAATFVERGWSVKQLDRLILTSSTYRQRSTTAGETTSGGGTADADPDNRLLSHFSVRRLEAEALFDAMLSTTNALPRQPSGSALEFAQSSNRAMYVLTTGRSPKGLGPDVRKMLTLFDTPSDGQPTGRRPASATPAQSLFWLNSPLVTAFADGFAARLLKMEQLTDAKRVEMAYLLAVGRPPSPPIAEAALAFLKQCEEDGDEPPAAWAKLCQALFASTEFRYVE